MRKTGKRTTPCKYPNIQRWLFEHKMSYREFARKVGTTDCTICKMLNGSSETRLYIVKGVLAVTGMTFEEAFQEAGVSERVRGKRGDNVSV